MTTGSPLRLEFSDGREPLVTVESINDEAADVGFLIAPLEFESAPADIRRLLAQPTLTPAENEQVKTHFLFSRERLLEIIAQAGRRPQVAGGGELNSRDQTHDVAYPQLYVADPSIDYSRFDRVHVNTAGDGIGVDEIAQILWGQGVETHLHRPDGTVLRLSIACPAADRGWIVTYDGTRPHLTSLTNAAPGTKALVQVIGAPRWSMNYVD